MTWIVLGYTAVAVALLWIVTCLFVYGSIDKEISADAWHWKVYTSFYSNPPQSDCQYTRALIVLPALALLALIFISFFFGIGAICCLIKDWIIIPFFLGERVAPESALYYGQGLIGKQIKKCGDWRVVPDRKSFIPFSPAIVFFIGICVFYAYLAVKYIAEQPPTYIIDAINPLTLTGLTTIALLFLFQKQIRIGLRSGWAKWREKTCHRIHAPDMD